MTTTTPAADLTGIMTPEEIAVGDRNLALAAAFARATIANPSLHDEIPNGATLVLLPDDDPAFVETNIQLGLTALRRGQNVYFRYLPGATSREGEEEEPGR